MFKKKVLITILSCLLVFLVFLLFLESDTNNNMLTRMITISGSRSSGYMDNDLNVIEVDISNQENDSQDSGETGENKSEEEKNSNEKVTNNEDSGEVVSSDNDSNETSQESVSAEKVYDGMTLEELANKLERSLKNELSGKGYLYASYSLEKGVDPYLAVAISLEETGCNFNCSNLVKSCNNVGGMKGSGCGSYGAWSSLDEGIRAFIDNIYRNYVLYGLTTAETMNPKYAENPAWSTNVNNYITRIRTA